LSITYGVWCAAGVALLNASKVLADMIAMEENADTRHGIKIVQGACR
jgi:hypothetical protein